jgi:hypothetical protein
MLTKIPTTKEIPSFEGTTTIYCDQGIGLITSMMALLLLMSTNT